MQISRERAAQLGEETWRILAARRFIGPFERVFAE